MKILIVEDSEDIRLVLEQVLEGEGYELFFAENGLQGLEQAQNHLPDIILMDLSLPVLNGWDATRQLRLLDEFKRTPIIALTAHASKTDQEKAIEAGCTICISKPFDLDVLVQQISMLTS